MLCPNCHNENRSNAIFCVECGSKIEQACAACGTDNSMTAKFCWKCGARLSVTSPQNQRSDKPRKAPDGERRHLTVLFCDLVDSTGISTGLDPEEWRDISAQYRRSAADAVTRFGGHVAKYLGDGLMVYFGYPQAHEDDAERAVRSGLAIVDAIAQLNQSLVAAGRPRLSARVGIDTGSVVVASDADIFGDTPNIAAHLQAVAEPDSVLITAAVHRLVSGRFLVEERAPRILKGVAQPMAIMRVVRPSGVRSRLHAAAAASGGLTPFVGREDELRLLERRWERAREGEGQMILIVGEPGIGKSRLVRQFREAIADSPHTWVECSCESGFQSTPFYAVSEMLQQGFAWRGEEPSEARVARLGRALASSGIKTDEAVPLIAPLLNLSPPTKYPPLLMSPEQQRRKLFAILAEWVFATAQPQPLVLVVEDLHWSDPSTLELLQILADQGATVPLLLLYTARPEFRSPWSTRGHHAHLALDPLSRPQVRKMVSLVPGEKALADNMIEKVVRRTGGVPLFVEELTRLVMEAGGRSDGDQIPATLHDSLMSRLDRLGPAKEVAQVGAAIGRDFSYGLLSAVMPVSGDELSAALEKLTDAELLYARGIPPEATYSFKHALVQETAYQALLKSRRRELHRLIAKELGRGPSEKTAAELEILAQHYAEAGEIEPAVSTWQRAAALAVARGALKEAESHIAKAVGLIAASDNPPAHAQQELLLRLELGQVLIATRGYGAAEVTQAYSRARLLAEQLGDPTRLLFVLLGLWLSAFTRGELLAAQTLAEQLLDAAEHSKNPASMVWGNYTVGVTRYHLADLRGAYKHLSKALRFYDQNDYRNTPQDPGVLARCYLSWAEWQLGAADTARAIIRDALAFVNKLDRPFDLAFAQSFAAGLFLWLREPERASAHAEALITCANEHQLPFFSADGSVLRGRAIAELGRSAEGLELIDAGIAGSAASGQRTGLGYYLGFRAEVQLIAGAFDQALTSLEEAMRSVPEEQLYRPHFLRLRAEIRLELASGSDHGLLELAERDLLEAIGLAHSMNAKFYELRATKSLARMLRSRGDARAARDLLGSLYAGFTEGLDTPDLVETKELLQELDARPPV